jgi:hypothetical protein
MTQTYPQYINQWEIHGHIDVIVKKWDSAGETYEDVIVKFARVMSRRYIMMLSRRRGRQTQIFYSNSYLPLHTFHTNTLTSTITLNMADTKFQGWLGKDKDAVKGKMQWGDFEPKKWSEDDVDIEISHCGICGSDLHMLSSGWGPTPYRTSSPPTSHVHI